ncbi:hypothetical protein DBV14_06635 [Variovorax sp. KBW07]|uniref:hypothetical protein n=1 Tax=Variovorax sp. KBW07 TaxID=2153358 RepID=UPI000F55B9E3|nr:hypothetical protein [Variovorax sp. KBW07]RQO60238.1 hypothetical protein DBV14_06635 [Variovorax sp. KBW07]
MNPNLTRDFESLRAGLHALRAGVRPGATLTKLCTQQHGTGVLIPDPLNGVCRTVRKTCDAYLEFEPAQLSDAMHLVRAPAETATRFFWPEVPGSSVLFPASGFIAGFLSRNEFIVDDQVTYSVYSLKHASVVLAEKAASRCHSHQQRMRVWPGRNLVIRCPSCGADTDLDWFLPGPEDKGSRLR